ncbi:MAG: glycosyltransferase family 2 protein [Pseudomonadota bacterium]
MSCPLISIVMPVAESDSGTEAAIESILSQSVTHFEFIIVVAGYSNDMPQRLDRFITHDSRFRLINLPMNVGRGLARAIGGEAATGQYLVVMDPDVIALPHRLSQQVDFMESNPDITLAGADAVRIDGDERVKVHMPGNDAELKARLLLVDHAFVHPTVIMRRDFLLAHNLNYSSEWRINEDYELYSRMVRSGAVLANQSATVLEYHLERNSIDPGVQKNRLSLRRFLLHLYYPDLTGTEADALARSMQDDGRLDLLTAHAGLLAAEKATACSRSHHGEDKASANRILGNFQKRLEQALSIASQTGDRHA